MKMKHIILRDVNSKSSDFIEEFSANSAGFLEYICVFTELERVAVTEEVDGGVIVLSEKWVKGTHLEILREKFPNSKIILSSKEIKPEELMRLQYEKKSVDLFFKPKFKIEDYENMLESLTSEKTQLTSITSIKLEVEDEVTEDQSEQSENEPTTIEFRPMELGTDESDDYEDDDEEDAEINEEATQFTTPTIPLEFEDDGIELSGSGSSDSEESHESQDDETVKLETNGGIDLEGVQERESDGQEMGNSTFVRSLSSFTDELNNESVDDTVVDLAKELEGIDNIMGVTSARGDSERNLEQEIQSDKAVTARQAPSTTQKSTNYSQVNDVLKGKEEELLQIIARNEVLDEENRLLREKVIQLEDIASRANLDQKKQSLEVDESKIKLKILRKRHREELNELRMRSSVLEEKINILAKHNEVLKKQNSKVNRENVIDLKKVREREEELGEKIKLMNSDFNSQLSHREGRIAELKRKIDLLDFDLQESINREGEFKERIEILENRIYDLKKSLGQSLDQLDDYSEEHIQLLKKA